MAASTHPTLQQGMRLCEAELFLYRLFSIAGHAAPESESVQ